MRADPPPAEEPKRRRLAESGFHYTPRVRCPYLEQILRERAFLGMLTRFKADCHVDGKTHSFTGRHPAPPCISDPTTCGLFHRARDDENRIIARYTD